MVSHDVISFVSLQVSFGGCKFDLIITDLPEELPIPMYPHLQMSSLNEFFHSTDTIEAMFKFAGAYLHEDACIFVFLL